MDINVHINYTAFIHEWPSFIACVKALFYFKCLRPKDPQLCMKPLLLFKDLFGVDLINGYKKTG